MFLYENDFFQIDFATNKLLFKHINIIIIASTAFLYIIFCYFLYSQFSMDVLLCDSYSDYTPHPSPVGQHTITLILLLLLLLSYCAAAVQRKLIKVLL